MANDLTSAELGIFYMFEKPSTPLYIPRASNTVLFNLPQENLPEGLDIETRFGGGPGRRAINVNSVTTVQDLPFIVREIERETPFSNFHPGHMQAAMELVNLFMARRTADDLMYFAANIRDYINEGLFVFALSYVTIRRKDLRKVKVPSIVETLPSNFIPKPTIEKCEEEVRKTKIMSIPPERIVVEHDLDFSGTDLNLEHRVAYWREDYGINSHHWHWHLIFPFGMNVNRDRKGEIFFFMHTAMLARYDWERLSNGLPRVKGLRNFRETIETGYFSKLTVNNSSQNYGSRQDNTKLSDFSRRPFVVEPFTINDLEIWRQRLFDGIHQGFFIDRQGNRVSLSDNIDIRNGDKRGVDIVGDALEADADLSVNSSFYGNLHNLAHVIIASAHDPDGSHKENFGVIGNPSTSMRDPVFYRLHRFVDDMFQAYKLTQPPYEENELLVSGVKVEKIGVATGRDANTLRTFYDTKLIEASRGLDFDSTTPVDVNITRLNHKPFKYHILVNNTTRSDKMVTVRIYMAPKFNESRTEMSFLEQRVLWSEMDKFTFNLTTGSNHIQRQSSESSITIPEELTFRELESGDAATELPEAFCGCGWPQHMLVPRGTEGGMAFQLFVLLSDFELDRMDVANKGPSRSRCGKAVSYCGLLDEKFPDRRPMGYPFDRRPLSDVNNITSFANKYPNANLIDVTVQFSNQKE